VRVLLLITDLQPGGAPLRIAAIARGLKVRGVDVHVGCLAPAGPVSAALDAGGIPTFACRASSIRDIGAILRLIGHVRRIRPDLIHATLTHANVAARLVGRYLGVPVVGSTATIEFERPWHARLERWTARLDAAHVVNGRAVAEHVIDEFGLPLDRVHIVPPFVERVPDRRDRAAARAALALPPDAFVIAWAGRLDPVKRVDLLIDVVATLDDAAGREHRAATRDDQTQLASGSAAMRRDSPHLLIAGDGPMRAALEALLEGHAARGRVHFVGWQSDLSNVFSAADVLALPSRTEGMPNVVMQAMAFGLPVVGSDIPALRELAGAEGRILLAGHTREHFATALASLRIAAAPREHLAALAGDWAQRELRIENALDALLMVYSRAIPQAAASTRRSIEGR